MASGNSRHAIADHTPLMREDIFYMRIGGGAETALGNHGVERFKQVLTVERLYNEVGRAHTNGIF